jgi:hypothetical protein
MLYGLVVGLCAGGRPRSQTSSANIVRELDNGEADCFIKTERLKPAPRRNDVCHIGDPSSNRPQCLPPVLPRPLLCAGDPGPLTNETDAKVLAEASTFGKSEIGCVVFKPGLV